MIHCWVLLTQNPSHDLSSHSDLFMQKAHEIASETGIQVNLKNNYLGEALAWPIPNPCAKYSQGVVFKGKLAATI